MVLVTQHGCQVPNEKSDFIGYPTEGYALSNGILAVDGLWCHALPLGYVRLVERPQITMAGALGINGGTESCR